MTWDGKQFNNIGDANLTIDDLEIHNGILYASGGFSNIGGVNVGQIASYDGSDWHALGKEVHSSVTSIAFYKDTLYAFRNKNGKLEVIKYMGELSSSITKTTITRGNSIILYPNPVNHIVNIDGIKNIDIIEVYNSVGAVVFNAIGNKSINVSDWYPGIYYARINSEIFKIIKL
jgi:hypothetical protein